MQIIRIALDLAKNIIQVHAVDRAGKPVLRKAFKRSQIMSYFRDLPPCEVGMEACASAHDWGRRLQTLGHRVQLLPPQYVKAFVLGQKNDANDAAAICVAMARPEIPRVPVKTVAQQDQQALHRVRHQRMKHHTAMGPVAAMRGMSTPAVFRPRCRARASVAPNFRSRGLRVQMRCLCIFMV